MNDLIKKAVISKVAFQPPNPPSYKESKDLIYLECNHSKEKHNDKNDKKYEKVLVPAVFLSAKNSKQVILYSHGNATDLGQMMPYLQLLNTALKINVMGYDYQGYGLAKPKGRPPSEKRTYESIRAAADYLINTKGFNSDDIIVFGCSLGSGASVHLASNTDSDKSLKFRGVILQSAFISGLKTKLKIDKPIPFDIFPNLERIDKVDCPVFLIHGKADEIVPFEHALLLNKKLKYPYPDQLHISYAGHNNIIEVLSVERYVKKLYNFIKYLNKFHEEIKEKESPKELESESIETTTQTLLKSESEMDLTIPKNEEMIGVSYDDRDFMRIKTEDAKVLVDESMSHETSVIQSPVDPKEFTLEVEE